LWLDELVSVYVDRLADLGSVWRALCDSADAMPPLFHIATRTSDAVISDEATAARLPGAIGYWVACHSAWMFLRRRMSAAYAWCAVAVMLLPGPFYFATEGRTYGMVLGFSGLALLCWQPCIGPGRRPWHPPRTRRVSVLRVRFPLLRRVLDDSPVAHRILPHGWVTLTAGDSIPFP
jgi:hypothetical protein